MVRYSAARYSASALQCSAMPSTWRMGYGTWDMGHGTACECPRAGTTEGLHRTSSYNRRPPRNPATSTSTSSPTARPHRNRPVLALGGWRAEGDTSCTRHEATSLLSRISTDQRSVVVAQRAGSCPRSWRGPGKPAAFPFTATGPARPFTPGLDLALGGGADACVGAANDKGAPSGMLLRPLRSGGIERAGAWRSSRGV